MSLWLNSCQFSRGNTHGHTHTHPSPQTSPEKPFTGVGGVNELLYMFIVRLAGLLKSPSRLTLQSNLFTTLRNADIWLIGEHTPHITDIIRQFYVPKGLLLFITEFTPHMGCGWSWREAVLGCILGISVTSGSCWLFLPPFPSTVLGFWKCSLIAGVWKVQIIWPWCAVKRVLSTPINISSATIQSVHWASSGCYACYRF